MAPKILIVDDPQLGFGSASDVLEECQIELVDSAVGELRSCGTGADLILLGGTGESPLALCRQLRSHESPRSVPVLVVTDDEPDAIARALDAGATDVVARSVHPDVFRARVGATLRIGEGLREAESVRAELDAAQSDLSRASAELAQVAEAARYEATHDRVTGLLNRDSFTQRLRQTADQARRYDHMLAVLVIDLDRFKQVNDTLGHELGNELLRSVAKRLSSIVRRTDVLARLAGDEFAVALVHVRERAHARLVAGKIARVLAEPHLIEDQSLFVMPSIGIALYPSDGPEPDMLLRNADLAMGVAKRSKRLAFHFYDPAMDDQSGELLMIENGLREAAGSGEFELYYQPQLDSLTGDVVGAEALIRWNHPVRGLLAPETFLHVAESSGLIVPLGDWVVREAVRQRVAWNREGIQTFPISVNVSLHQLESPDFSEKVAVALREEGLDGHLLHFELTESCLTNDADLVALQLEDLRQRGIAIHIDDFGTGYSSLSKLGRFSIDTLKIDRSFVHRIDLDSKHTSIAKAVVALADGLGFDTIAEGVESREELVALQKVGCRRVQGFLYSPPLSAAAFAEWCRKRSLRDV